MSWDIARTGAIGEMRKVLAAASSACEGDVARMVAAMIGAIVTVASQAPSSDDLLRIAAEMLDHARRHIPLSMGKS